VAKLYPQALANFVIPSSDTEPEFRKTPPSLWLIVHSYKFKICVHNSLQNNGMVLFVVKILAAGVRRAMDSDVLASFNAIWKIPADIEVFRNFCKYFICWRRHVLCL
jgi:hypothetical protein